jgi:hypothetical protein
MGETLKAGRRVVTSSPANHVTLSFDGDVPCVFEGGGVGEGEGGGEEEVLAGGGEVVGEFGEGEAEFVGAGDAVPGGFLVIERVEGDGPGIEEGALVDEGGLVEEVEAEGAQAFGGVAELVLQFDAGFEGVSGCGCGSGGRGGRGGDLGEVVDLKGGGGEHVGTGAGERGRELCGGAAGDQKGEGRHHEGTKDTKTHEVGGKVAHGEDGNW